MVRLSEPARDHATGKPSSPFKTLFGYAKPSLKELRTSTFEHHALPMVRHHRSFSFHLHCSRSLEPQMPQFPNAKVNSLLCAMHPY